MAGQGGVTMGGPSGFTHTKKNLPTLKKITGAGGGGSKPYVSPYSLKAIQKP